MKKRAKRIEIVQSTLAKKWYSDLIGAEFDVDSQSRAGYNLTVGGLDKFIWVSDAKIIEYYSRTFREWCKYNDVHIGDKITHDDSDTIFTVIAINEYIQCGGRGFSETDKLHKYTPKYRPCETFEEGLQFLGAKVMPKDNHQYAFIISDIDKFGLVAEDCDIPYDELFEKWKLVDGTPVGVKL